MLYTTLRKLPRILTNAFTPEHLIPCVSQYDADIWAITVTVYHKIRPTNLFFNEWIVPQFTPPEKKKGVFALNKYASVIQAPVCANQLSLLCWLSSFSSIITW